MSDITCIPFITIKFAEGCAWRAFYIYSGKLDRWGYGGPMRFSLGIDPTFRHGQAVLFGCIGFRKDCTGGRKGVWHWRLPLWRARYWWKLDGRRVSR